MVRWTLRDDLNMMHMMQLSFPKTAADWQLIAENLTQAAPDSGTFTGRGARERWMKTILIKFKCQNTASLKRSGTEEDYTELDNLIQDLADRQSDLDAEAVECTMNERKKREEGIKLRNISMLSLKRKQEEMNTSNSDDPLACSSPISSLEDLPAYKPRTSKGSTQRDVLVYMKERDEKANELRREELQIEKQKVENERQRVENEGKQIALLQQLLLNQQNLQEQMSQTVTRQSPME